jgi:hypothetical protein
MDEAFNRVIRKLEEGEPINDVPTYCHDVARLVFLKSLEHPSNMENEKWIRGRQVCLSRIHFIWGIV